MGTNKSEELNDKEKLCIIEHLIDTQIGIDTPTFLIIIALALEKLRGVMGTTKETIRKRTACSEKEFIRAKNKLLKDGVISISKKHCKTNVIIEEYSITNIPTTKKEYRKWKKTAKN